MQATVHTFDPATYQGSLITDDGILVPLDPEAFELSALRLLRPGQRLTVEITGRGSAARVTALAIETVGMPPARPSRP